jgi:hypothetical protein
MKLELLPHGFSPSDYKKLTRYANDKLRPLNIGRHAPNKGAELRYVNVIGDAFADPRSREVFVESSHICRSTVDAFIRYLKLAKTSVRG